MVQKSRVNRNNKLGNDWTCAILICLILSAYLPARSQVIAYHDASSTFAEGPSDNGLATPKTRGSDPDIKDAGMTPASVSAFLQGQVTYTVPQGTPLKLKLATVPTYSLKMMERDLEGNLYPAKLGQEITARTSEDLYVDANKVIPEGTVFHGRVTKILPARRVGRPGSLVLSFDQLITPDGRRFAFRAEADNFKPSTLRTKAKGFGIIAAHAAGGAIVGALVAYELFGLHETIALHGYNIAGGAAAGALLATGYAIMRRGPAATLEPGDDLNLQIDSDLLMPVAVEGTSKPLTNSIPGLAIKIEKSKLVNDGLDGRMLVMDALITNDSDLTLSSIDLYLEDTNGNRSAVWSSDDDDAAFLFTVEPHSRQHLNLSFNLRYPKLKHKLVWLNHEDKTVCYRQPLP